jgi:hypothetical protein
MSDLVGSPPACYYRIKCKKVVNRRLSREMGGQDMDMGAWLRQGDGWLMRKMVAKQGDEWLRQGDGWQSREMGGLVESPPCYSGFESKHLSKI